MSPAPARIAFLLVLSVASSPAFPFGDPSRFENRSVDWDVAALAKPPAELRTHLAKRPTRSKLLKRTIFIDKPGTYDFKNVVHIAAFSSHCDQKEGRPPALHIRSGGVTVKNWVCVGSGHDGIHVHSGKGQGMKARGKVDRVRLINCWQQACEDAMTVGFRTSRVSIESCGFMPNPNGEHRDKLLQVNHADRLSIKSCYFGPTKNGIEFKSGAVIIVERSVFDHCNTGIRVNTADSYGGIKSNRPTKITTKRCTFIANKRAGALDGTVTWRSEGDRFEGCRRKGERSGDARFDLR